MSSIPSYSSRQDHHNANSATTHCFYTILLTAMIRLIPIWRDLMSSARKWDYLDHDNVSEIHARTKETWYSDQTQTERKENIILLFIWPTNDGPTVTRVFVDVVCPCLAFDSCSVLWTLRTARHESSLTVILAKTRTPHLTIAEDAAACIHRWERVTNSAQIQSGAYSASGMNPLRHLFIWALIWWQNPWILCVCSTAAEFWKAASRHGHNNIRSSIVYRTRPDIIVTANSFDAIVHCPHLSCLWPLHLLPEDVQNLIKTVLGSSRNNDGRV